MPFPWGGVCYGFAWGAVQALLAQDLIPFDERCLLLTNGYKTVKISDLEKQLQALKPLETPKTISIEAKEKIRNKKTTDKDVRDKKTTDYQEAKSKKSPEEEKTKDKKTDHGNPDDLCAYH